MFGEVFSWSSGDKTNLTDLPLSVPLGGSFKPEFLEVKVGSSSFNFGGRTQFDSLELSIWF